MQVLEGKAGMAAALSVMGSSAVSLPTLALPPSGPSLQRVVDAADLAACGGGGGGGGGAGLRASQLPGGEESLISAARSDAFGALSRCHAKNGINEITLHRYFEQQHYSS